MSQRSKLIVVLIAVVAGVWLASSTVGSEALPMEQVGVEVNIAAVDSHEGRYECTAVVTDLASERILSAPRVVFEAGKEAQIQSSTQAGLRLHIVVSVNEGETQAQYSASIHRGEELVSSQKVQVALGRS